jgi:hypothetical protein
MGARITLRPLSNWNVLIRGAATREKKAEKYIIVRAIKNVPYFFTPLL